MIRNLILTLGLLLTFSGLYAQIPYQFEKPVGLYRLQIRDPKNSGIAGSPYLSEEWANGWVKLRGSKVMNNQQIRYNIVDGNLEVMIDNQVYGASQQLESFGWEKNGEAIVFRSSTELIKSPNAFFYQVFYDGKTKLLRSLKSTVSEEPDPSGGIGATRKTYVMLERYFLLKNGDLTEVRKNKKVLLEMLNNQQALVEQFIDSQKLKFKDWADVKALLTYYDTL